MANGFRGLMARRAMSARGAVACMAPWNRRARWAKGVATDGWRSVQAGWAAIGLVGLTMATFGPFFHIALAYALLAGAFGAAVCSLRWADRVAHAETVPGLGRRDAHRGQVLSGIALLLIFYYTGAWVLLVVLFPIALVVGLIGWSVHLSRVQRSCVRPDVGP